MKQLDYFINEKLKVNSKSTIKNTTTDIANYLGIDIKYAKEIEDKYLNKNYLSISKECEKYLLATQFELVFMLAIMLVDDNKDYSDIIDLGFNLYKGKNNPYDYTWYEEGFIDSNGTEYTDILEYIQKLFKNSKEFRELFKEVYDFCKKANINNPEKFFDIYEYIN